MVHSPNPENFTNPEDFTLEDYLMAASYLKNRKGLLGADDIAKDAKERINNIILGMRYFQKKYHLEVKDIFCIDALVASAEQSKNKSDIDMLAMVPRPSGEEVSDVLNTLYKKKRREYETLALILNETSIGCWLLEFQNGAIHVINVNESICKMLGLPEEEIIGKNINEFLDPRSQVEIAAQSQDIFTQKHREFTLHLPKSDKTTLPVKISATSLGANGPGTYRVMAMVTDISELHKKTELLRKNTLLAEEQARRLEEQARRLMEVAITDALTGVYNRRHLDEELDRNIDGLKLKNIQEMALILIDIDHFKNVNDEHGHEVGDEVLRRVGKVLLTEFKNSQASPFRQWWEEFLLQLRNVSAIDAEKKAERLRQAIEDMEIPLPSGEILKITASVGMLHQKGDREEYNPRDLMISVDALLYRAKEGGRNRVIVGKE